MYGMSNALNHSSNVFDLVYNLQNMTQEEVVEMYNYTTNDRKSVESAPIRMLRDIGVVIKEATIQSLIELARCYGEFLINK